jgi:hypothetical protein
MISKFHLLSATTASMFLIASGSGACAATNDTSQKIIVTRVGSQPSCNAPTEHFTGSARIDPLFESKDPSISAAYVTFEPGAHSAWHTHPLAWIPTQQWPPNGTGAGTYAKER